MPEAEQILRSAYKAFNARDIEAAVELMHPDVDWPNAWEGGRADWTASACWRSRPITLGRPPTRREGAWS